jgi:molecular chaperone HscB
MWLRQLVLDVTAGRPPIANSKPTGRPRGLWVFINVNSTHFELLGLPQRFALDPAALEASYLAKSRDLHPDFHQLASSVEQRLSLELSAALNEANAILRDPFRRAEYLLALAGGPRASEHKEMSPEFLEEMLELRMEIEELREAGNPDSPARRAMEERLNQRKEGLVKSVGQAFARIESLPAGDAKGMEGLLQVRKLLNSAKYIQGLLRDLRAD